MPRSSATRYDVTIDGRARAVELEDVADDAEAAGPRLTRLTRLTIDGQERTVDARPLGGGLWSILDGNTVRLLQVSGAGPKLTVEVGSADGEPRTAVAEVAATRSASASVSSGADDRGPASLPAPIPGRLVKVLVKAGDKVSAGQALLVLEAMKMENEVRAPRAGTVKAVHVGEGIAVETGQLLVSIE